MSETGLFLQESVQRALLPSHAMATNRALRQRVKLLVKHGVSQKVLANRMGLTESWLSRWLNATDAAKTPMLTVEAMDRLREFEHELGNLLLQGGPPSSAGAPFPETEGQDPQLQSGERKR